MPVRPIPTTTTATHRRLSLSVPGHGQSDEGRAVDELAVGFVSKPAQQLPFPNPDDRRAAQEALQRTIGRVWEIFFDEEEMTEDSQRVSLQAADTACRLLSHAYYQGGYQFREAEVTSDDTGGLYVYWGTPGRQMHLHVQGESDSKPSVFHRTQSHYGVVADVDAASLVYWLGWLEQA
jgi:hypothetical protein